MNTCAAVRFVKQSLLINGGETSHNRQSTTRCALPVVLHACAQDAAKQHGYPINAACQAAWTPKQYFRLFGYTSLGVQQNYVLECASDMRHRFRWRFAVSLCSNRIVVYVMCASTRLSWVGNVYAE